MKKLIFIFSVLFVSNFAVNAQSDNCATALVLNECEITFSVNNGATVGADDTFAASEICAITKEKSVWYRFTASQTGAYTIAISNNVCNGSTNLKCGIFSGSCSSLTPINCNASTSSFLVGFNAVAGQTYFIVIDGSTGSDCSFDFIVCPGCEVNAGFTSSVTTGNYPLTVNFTNTSSGGLYHHWDFGTNLQEFDGFNSSFVYEEPGTFIVTLISGNGICNDTITDTIIVTGQSAIEIPNVFTPNNDNVNDVFHVKCFGIDTIDVQIFNRWGELIGGYSGNNGSWDGYSIIAGLPVSTGTYYIYVKAIGIDGTVFDERSILQLFR